MTEFDQRPLSPGPREQKSTFLHIMPFNANPQTITWERLEQIRLAKLHLGPERYSRHFQRFVKPSKSASLDLLRSHDRTTVPFLIVDGEVKKANSVAPFATVGKPTCGYFFSRATDNKKKKFGIPPSDLVKWRSFVR
ncbi:hypothetical protein CHS0354_020262 [Potamilus streckersoni]|uniref:Uncharacterized protein n=1 Tax=Potamilus streckersoni TaxID=2493646 RepID=A0AAE0S5F0_9BIVA|nr:hypothetical protein CHS0354_020262 [Potamilus streckersoni]